MGFLQILEDKFWNAELSSSVPVKRSCWLPFCSNTPKTGLSLCARKLHKENAAGADKKKEHCRHKYGKWTYFKHSFQRSEIKSWLHSSSMAKIPLTPMDPGFQPHMWEEKLIRNMSRYLWTFIYIFYNYLLFLSIRQKYASLESCSRRLHWCNKFYKLPELEGDIAGCAAYFSHYCYCSVILFIVL